MAFTDATLASLLGHNSRAGQLWTYKTADNAATVEGANYFNSAADRLSAGDIILAVVTETGPVLVAHLYLVTSNDGTTVVISDELAAHA